MSWLKGLGGDHHDTASASRYLGLPVLARPKVSVLLDRDFYLDQYPDVRDSGADPLIHFITSGCAEGRSPNPLVDISHIRRQDASLLPSLPSVRDLYEVLHYGLVDPGPYFSLDYYREQVASRSREAAGLLEHFLTTGLRLGIRPNPFFDPLWYYRQLDGMHDVWSGLRHFVMSGDREGLAPSPEFSGKRYFERYPDVANAGIPALFHFLTAGRPEGRS